MRPPFANLREWVIWLADGGHKNTPCCRSAEDAEVQAQPDLFDCTSCAWARLDRLWPENAEAWRCYQTLCGRTVGTFELHAWALDRFTADMTPRECAGLVERLDLILKVLQPESTADGSDQARHSD